MRILVLGAGMQGTLYGVRLARAGHAVTLVARGTRAAELERGGAIIEHVRTHERITLRLPVIAALDTTTVADLCLVTVRREQLTVALEALHTAPKIGRALVMVNFAGRFDHLFGLRDRARVVLGFPGAAGGINDGVDRYVLVTEQPTAVEAHAVDVAQLLESAGFPLERVPDMESWLMRHAVFVTAMAGALATSAFDADRLARDPVRVRQFITAVREGWHALDRLHVHPPPLALRAILTWVPKALAAPYWQRLMRTRGDMYFARHTRHARAEMATLGADVLRLIRDVEAPHFRALLRALDDAPTLLPGGRRPLS